MKLNNLINQKNSVTAPKGYGKLDRKFRGLLSNLSQEDKDYFGITKEIETELLEELNRSINDNC